MDPSIRVPYYFPPQRYIPRLGGGFGGGRGAESPIGAGFEGVGNALEMLMRLKEAKELKEERLSNQRLTEQDRAKDREEREADRRERQSEGVERAAEASRARNEAARDRELAYESRTGINLDPGAAASAWEALDPNKTRAAQQRVTDVSTPQGAGQLAAGLANSSAGAAGLGPLYERVAAQLPEAYKSGLPQVVPGAGVAVPPAGEVSALVRGNTSTRTGLDTRHSRWMDAKVRWVHNNVAEQERDNPGMTPDEISQASQAAQDRFDQLFPEPGAEGPEKNKQPKSAIGAYLDAHPDLVKGLIKP